MHLLELRLWPTSNQTIASTIVTIRDMFHVYLNGFEFHFLRLHMNKTNSFCFLMHKERVPGIAR